MCYEHKKCIIAFLLNLHKVLQRITCFFTGKFHMLPELENLELKDHIYKIILCIKCQLCKIHCHLISAMSIVNPKIFHVLSKVIQKLKNFLNNYLVHIKYWQILGF